MRNPKPLINDASTGTSTNAASDESLLLRMAISTHAIVSAPQRAKEQRTSFRQIETVLSIGSAMLICTLNFADGKIAFFRGT